MIGLFGGAFDPPHNGHVALARAAIERFALEDLEVLVAASPGHKRVETAAEIRLELARAAFPEASVQLDPHSRTVDTLRAHPEWVNALFLLGADEFSQFLNWKDPTEVLRYVSLGVATRPGYPPEGISTVLDRLPSRERVTFFDLEPMPIASSELRARLDRGDDVQEYVPVAVWELIEQRHLYGRRYTAGV
jgi:nicotinate-nucleotide adenylyltransferase